MIEGYVTTVFLQMPRVLVADTIGVVFHLQAVSRYRNLCSLWVVLTLRSLQVDGLRTCMPSIPMYHK